ncbi:MAG TPA: hypothetical protein VHU80_19140 [Polyangiaceae bacterium]|jgi:hypothetical protein|nr:hypothetical protein [Polyangiaceae bacterium]
MTDTDIESFERAFVAVTYLLGRRDGLLDGLAAPGDGARRAARIAAEPNQVERAKRLATELLAVVTAFETRRLE